MGLLTRKLGLWLIAIGVAMQFLNILTYSLWEIDIDVLGLMIFIMGLVIAIACGKSIKYSSQLFSRINGVRLSILAAVVTMIFAFSPFPALNGDVAGIIGISVFVLGLIIIALRWRY